MAKKRRSRRAPIASARTIPVRPILSDPVLLPQFDRRLFHPDLVKPAFGVRIGDTRLRVATKPLRPSLYKEPQRIMFAVPKRVAVCVRRKRRREVIFAKGKNGGGNRRGKKNFWSDVACR